MFALVSAGTDTKKTLLNKSGVGYFSEGPCGVKRNTPPQKNKYFLVYVIRVSKALYLGAESIFLLVTDQ